MDKNLTLRLECNGKTLELDNKNYKIVRVDGIESSDYDVNIINNAIGDGGQYNKSLIRSRPISIEFDYMDIKNSEDIRQYLIKFFNPRFQGTLFINYDGVERYISYRLERFKNKRTNLYEPLNIVADLICPEPHFNDVFTSEEIATWIGGWKFKFKLPFRFKQKGKPRKNVYNDGHLETPIKIIFKGPAVNPKVTNLTTGEFIQVNRTLTSDDILYINTEFGNKTVEIEKDGVKKNAFNYINLDSTFFKLQVGDNLIEYGTENNLDPQSVQIIYRNKYLGI